jgi:hypothetical protein
MTASSIDDRHDARAAIMGKILLIPYRKFFMDAARGRIGGAGARMRRCRYSTGAIRTKWVGR